MACSSNKNIDVLLLKKMPQLFKKNHIFVLFVFHNIIYWKKNELHFAKESADKEYYNIYDLEKIGSSSRIGDICVTQLLLATCLFAFNSNHNMWFGA